MLYRSYSNFWYILYFDVFCVSYELISIHQKPLILGSHKWLWGKMMDIELLSLFNFVDISQSKRIPREYTFFRNLLKKLITASKSWPLNNRAICEITIHFYKFNKKEDF